MADKKVQEFEFEMTKKHHRFQWDEQKDASLRWRYLVEKKTYAEIQRELGCTYSQLQRRLKVLDIYRTRSRFWTPERDAILEKYYLQEDNSALARRLGCAENYVADRLTYLGFFRPKNWKNAVDG